MPPVRLSGSEMDAVFAAAAPLDPHVRDEFLQHVADQLSTCAVIGPGTVAKACREAQKKYFDPPQLNARDAGKYR